MKKLALALIVGIMLGYMLCLVHQLAQQEQRQRDAGLVISKMENTTED